MKAFTIACILFATVALESASSLAVPKLTIITVPNGGPWGSWGGIEVCPGNSSAIGFALKVEYAQGAGDDTALNGIALDCYDPQTHTITEIKSAEGEWGNWGARVTCLEGGFLTAFSLRVEPDLSTDDTAANDLRFRCNTGEVLEGHGMDYGTWGEWSAECPAGICGIETKVEENQVGGDDTALNDVRFLCC